MSFQAVQAMDMDQFGHLVYDPETGRCLGGAGRSFYRVWVFPLYTPRGKTVVQEYPFDHPFHNGFFVGQHPVLLNGVESNFWLAPPPRSSNDPAYVALGRVDAGSPTIETGDKGVSFVFNSVWRDEHEQPVLDEVRTIKLQTLGDATVCTMTSRKTASYGALEFARTKMGGLGLRVEPRLLPALGGVVIADNDRRGTTDIVHEQDSGFVAYQSAGDDNFGVCMIGPETDKTGAWFVRDYGMALYNPTWREPVATPAGESWEISLSVVAYDGSLYDGRVERWRSGLM